MSAGGRGQLAYPSSRDDADGMRLIAVGPTPGNYYENDSTGRPGALNTYYTIKQQYVGSNTYSYFQNGVLYSHSTDSPGSTRAHQSGIEMTDNVTSVCGQSNNLDYINMSNGTVSGWQIGSSVASLTFIGPSRPPGAESWVSQPHHATYEFNGC